jgi:hypothetical protein
VYFTAVPASRHELNEPGKNSLASRYASKEMAKLFSAGVSTILHIYYEIVTTDDEE